MSLDERSRSPTDIEELRERRERIKQILDGSLPSTDERLCAFPPCKGSESDDRRLFAQSLTLRHKDKLNEAGLALLELVAADGSIDTLRAARDLMLAMNDGAAARRLQLYAALAGDTASAWPLGGYLVALRSWRFSVHGIHRLALGLSLLAVRPGDNEGSVEELAAASLVDLRDFAGWTTRLDAVVEALESEGDEKLAGSADIKAAEVDEVVAQLGQHLDEKGTTDAPVATDGDDNKVVVVPPFSVNDKKRASAARDVAKAMETMAGEPLPLVELGDPAAIRRLLEPRFPHFRAELDMILRRRLPWKLLFVGEPGSGKTAFARLLSIAAGLPFMFYSCAGSSDGSFAGTSAQWATARASIPLQLIHRSRIANPVVVLDEIDKASADRRNGAIVDVLLNFLEPESSRRVMDLGLELEVDVSRVSYIATANRIEDVPVALRDRFKILRMPSPGLEHFDHFVRSIFDDITAERDLDRRWIDALARDEAELVRNAWQGGSLRRLRRILELVVDGRDCIWGRA